MERGEKLAKASSLRSGLRCICQNCKRYLFKFYNVFISISKCNCTNCKIYLSHLEIVFVQIAKTRQVFISENWMGMQKLLKLLMHLRFWSNPKNFFAIWSNSNLERIFFAQLSWGRFSNKSLTFKGQYRFIMEIYWALISGWYFVL